MAQIQTTITPAARIFPFTGLGETGQQRSMLPRAEVVFSGIDVAVTIAGAGDSQRLLIDCQLPLNFAYAIAECSLQLKSTDVVNWKPIGKLALQDSDATGRTFQTSVELESRGTIEVVSSALARVWTPNRPLPRIVMLQVPGEAQSRVDLSVSNATLDQAAGTAIFYVRVLQYDITQAHSVLVNTPQLVR